VITLTFVSSINKEDHVTYFQHIVHGMKSELWKDKMWDLFITTSFSSVDTEIASGFPSWVQPNIKQSFISLRRNFPKFAEESFDSASWEKWAKSEDCYSNFPIQVSTEERLLLIKILRPDNLINAIVKYCCNEIGVESLSPISETLSQHWNENLAASLLPIMLVTMKEADPGNEIRALAGKLQRRYDFKQIRFFGAFCHLTISFL
jgi:hypothetical protein